MQYYFKIYATLLYNNIIIPKISSTLKKRNQYHAIFSTENFKAEKLFLSHTIIYIRYWLLLYVVRMAAEEI